jgi:TRAP-type C4-dicarboxylate transport system substrate-binding protein
MITFAKLSKLSVTAWTMAIALTLPFAAGAEPIQLKLAYYGSEQGKIYLAGVKPFVDGVNTEGKGIVTIDVNFDGALGKAYAQQPRLVLDGLADIAYVTPGQTPYLFPDNGLLEQPGLFRDVREGTLVYTRLIAAGALRGYQDFFVIGAYTAAPNIIHSREPMPSLASIKGQKLRVNNAIEAEAMERLGAVPNVLDAPKVANAIAKGALDGTSMSPMGVYEFGVVQVAKNHYLLRSGIAPLLVLMNRKTFDALPEPAKALVRKYSGERAAATWIGTYGVGEMQMLDKIKSDPDRKVVEPSPSDREAAEQIYRSMIDAWAAKSAHNRVLLAMTRAELATTRAGK